MLWGFISRGTQCAQDWGEEESSGLGRNYRRSWSCTDWGSTGGHRLLSAVFDICKVDILQILLSCVMGVGCLGVVDGESHLLYYLFPAVTGHTTLSSTSSF